MSFFTALVDPSLPFIRNVKRIAGLAGAISHAVLGGIGMSLFLASTGMLPGLPPIAGALLFAVLSACLIGFVALRARQREDTVINAIWAIGMSIGILFIAKTPGYADPMSYLFGNILLVTPTDLVLLAILDLVVILGAWRFYPQIEASSFDEEFARTRGVDTELVFLAILIVVAIAVVLLQTFVGIVMVIAMLTLPAGTAGRRASSLAAMMVVASMLSAVFCTAGLALSWSVDLPAGAVVVVLSGFVFLAVSGAGVAIASGRRKGGPGPERRDRAPPAERIRPPG